MKREITFFFLIISKNFLNKSGWIEVAGRKECLHHDGDNNSILLYKNI